MKGCKGIAVRFAGKKDSRFFWKCRRCGNFFDDADGRPEVREKREKREKGNKKGGGQNARLVN